VYLDLARAKRRGSRTPPAAPAPWSAAGSSARRGIGRRGRPASAIWQGPPPTSSSSAGAWCC